MGLDGVQMALDFDEPFVVDANHVIGISIQLLFAARHQGRWFIDIN